MKTKERKSLGFDEPKTEPLVLRDAAVVAGEQAVTVREAKAHLSALLDWVTGGRSVMITSDGRPKARLVSARADKPRKVFAGAAAHLARMPEWSGGPTAEEIVREDRDGRGW